MASSPTPSLDSMRGIETFIEHNGYLSDSPLTLSGSSPPVSDSAICDDFANSVAVGETVVGQHPISASVSSTASADSGASCSSSSSSSSSGLSGCGSTSSSTSGGSPEARLSEGSGDRISPSATDAGKTSTYNSLMNGLNTTKATAATHGSISLTTANDNTSNSLSLSRCTACKSKQSDAVAKCYDCLSFLCGSCVTAHEFMHCFNGHNIIFFKGFENGLQATSAAAGGVVVTSSTSSTLGHINNPTTTDFKLSSSLTMMLQQQQQQQQHNMPKQVQHQLPVLQQPLSQLTKIVLGSAAASSAASATSAYSTTAEMNGAELMQTPVITDLFGPLIPSTIRTQPLISYPNRQQQHNQQQSSSLSVFCQRHKNEFLKFNCRTCCTLVCKDCIAQDHLTGQHDIEPVQENNSMNVLTNLPSQSTPETVLQTILADLRSKVGEIMPAIDSYANLGENDLSVNKMKMQYQRASAEINETFQFYCSMLDERKHDLLKELENIYNVKISSYSNALQRSKDLVDKTLQTCENIERSPKSHSIAEVLILRKNLELSLQTIMQELQTPFELEFMSNYQSIQASVRNTFGYIRTSIADANFGLSKQPPIARPTQSISSASSHGGGSSNSSVTGGSHLPSGLGLSNNFLDSSYSNANSILLNRASILGGGNTHTSNYEDLVGKRFVTSTNVANNPFVSVPVNNPYEKWSNGGTENVFSSSATDPFSNNYILTNSLTNAGNAAAGVCSNGSVTNMGANNALSLVNANSATDSLMDLTTKLLATPNYPPKSQIKRQKMIYHCKFGEFGVMEGQFTEPSGVAVNAQNDIIVADTNNHRIQIFDKEGRFKFQFGECGKRDSQLLYPNRVAVVRNTGDIIVTERSPTHQIQIYNQYGQFVRKFGANILQHPRGVTVDNKGRIIVVECKVMRVIIFDQNGNVLHKFGCSKHLEFPNGVVVNDKQEIFISDNRAHCVKVFNYDGQYLRQIGGEGITNYPIGVGINMNGEILIADNHNNFNLTIFSQDGQLMSALESKVKHAQCFDVSLMDDGSVVLASKDYRLYIYRYVQVPAIGL